MSTHMGTLLSLRGRVDRWGQDPKAVEEHRALARMVDEMAREYWDEEGFHRQVAADLAQVLEYDFWFRSPLGRWLDVEPVGEFDHYTLTEERGLKVFYTARGGYIEESQLDSEDWELPRDSMGFHVSEHEDKLRAGFAASMEKMVRLGRLRLEAEPQRRVIQLLQAAVPNSSPYYYTSASLLQADLNEAITNVADAVQPGGEGPAPVSIVGRAPVVDQISDFSGFTEEAQEEIRQTGRLGLYRGAGIERLQNYQDEDGESYMPANELWVMSGRAGKFVTYGGQRAKTWDANTVDYRHYRTRQDVGGLVNHPEQVRRFVITGITP